MTDQCLKFFVWLGCVGLLSLSATAQEPPTGADKLEPNVIQQAIDELGDASFQIRTQAVQRLRSAGMQAEPILKQNLRNPNLEIRLRVAELISEIKRNDLQDRLNALLSFRATGSELGLPGWDAYVEIVGDSKPTRDLYAEMIKLEYPVMQLCELEDPAQISDELTSVIKSLDPNPQMVDLGSYAAFLLVACQASDPSSNIVSYIYSASHRPPVNTELKAGNSREPLRAMLETFLSGIDTRYATYTLHLSVEYDLKAGVKFAVTYLETMAGQSQYQARVALMCLAKFGDESHLPVLERQFGDQREIRVYLNGKQVNAQVQDFALAACLYITGEPLETYELVTNPTVSREELTSSLNLGFMEDVDREAAFKKWKARRAELIASEQEPAGEAETAEADKSQAPAAGQDADG